MRLSREVFTGTASEGLEEPRAPRPELRCLEAHPVHVRAAPCKPHLVLHLLLPAALWPRTWEKWECCLSVVASLVGECPWAGFLGGTPGGDAWRGHLEGTPGGHAWRAHLEDAPGGRHLEDTPGGHTWRVCLEGHLEGMPGGHTWRAHLEDAPGGHAWRTRLEGTPGGRTWKETSGDDLLLPKHSPTLP